MTFTNSSRVIIVKLSLVREDNHECRTIEGALGKRFPDMRKMFGNTISNGSVFVTFINFIQGP